MAQLKKQLGLLDVFAVAAGAMISSGLFVLPAIAFARAGSAVVFSYFLAAILIVPSVLSQAELATAMPRAGGTYFFVERSLGSIWGLFGGLADWFSLAMKSAFSVVGMAIFVDLLVETAFGVKLNEYHFKAIGVLCCLCFTVLNILSVKQTGRFQVILVAILLLILAVFVAVGLKAFRPVRFEGLLEKGWLRVLATTGLVFVSFGGLNKVVNVSEEVKHPDRNLPLGMLLACVVVTIFYIAVVSVTVGVVDSDELAVSYTPISTAAAKFMGGFGFVIMAIAAVAAFVTTANAGILAASRSPMAMSRDRLLPPFFARVSKRFETPDVAIILTSGFMVTAIIFLDIEMLAKTASTLLIILYILTNISVIVMRESRIQSYRPKFKSPLYPYIHIAAIIAYTALIIDMGFFPLVTTISFFALSAAWFALYASRRVSRASAVMHVVERVTDKQLGIVTLENELRDILLERDNIIEDRFDKLIRNCEILDIPDKVAAEEIFRKISTILAERLGTSEYVLFEKFLHREAESGTVVQPGLAIPHIVVEGEKKFDILLVRAVNGINFPHAPDPVRIMFVLAGSKDERNYHLRALMAIAQIAQEKDFEKRWFDARDTAAIRNLILLSTRIRDTKA